MALRVFLADDGAAIRGDLSDALVFSSTLGRRAGPHAAPTPATNAAHPLLQAGLC